MKTASGALSRLVETAEVARQLLVLARELELLLLREALERAGLDHVLELAHALDALVDRPEVREHAAQPAEVDVGHPGPRCLLLDRVLDLLLGGDEQDRAAAGDEVAGERVGLFDPADRLLQVEDVDAVALREDESLHLRVPTAGLVAEMDPSLE